MKLFPVALNLAGRRCLVVGGGSVAARKAASLKECGAQVVLIAPQSSPEISALEVEVRPREFQPGDCAGMALVFACTNNSQVNAAIRDEARGLNIWCGAADATGDLNGMAAVRRGDLTIALSTSGGSPALARHLKEKIAATIGPEYETLLEILAERRKQLDESLATQSDRAAFWNAILCGPVLQLLRKSLSWPGVELVWT